MVTTLATPRLVAGLTLRHRKIKQNWPRVGGAISVCLQRLLLVPSSREEGHCGAVYDAVASSFCQACSAWNDSNERTTASYRSRPPFSFPSSSELVEENSLSSLSLVARAVVLALQGPMALAVGATVTPRPLQRSFPHWSRGRRSMPPPWPSSPTLTTILEPGRMACRPTPGSLPCGERKCHSSDPTCFDALVRSSLGGAAVVVAVADPSRWSALVFCEVRVLLSGGHIKASLVALKTVIGRSVGQTAWPRGVG